MASITSNIITKGLQGRLGDALVFKTMHGKTFVSIPARLPDKQKASAAQRTTRVNFQQASQWAQLILLNPEQKTYYQQRAKALKLPNAYTAALTDYMRKPNVATTRNGNTVTYSITKPGFTLQQVSVDKDETSQAPIANVTIRQRNNKWLVHQPITEGSAPAITLMVTDNCERTTRFKAAG